MNNDINRATRELSVVWDAVCSAADRILASVDDIDAVNDAACIQRPEAILGALNKIRTACAFRDDTADRIALVIGLLSRVPTEKWNVGLLDSEEFNSTNFESIKADFESSGTVMSGSRR